MVIGFAVVVSVRVWQPAFIAAAAFWIVAAPAWLWLGLSARQRNGLIPLGFLLLVPPALAMVVLEPLDALLALAVAWIADTAAYFAGRRWGRHKLAPSISPGKTWEGAAGGLIGRGGLRYHSVDTFRRNAGNVDGGFSRRRGAARRGQHRR